MQELPSHKLYRKYYDFQSFNKSADLAVPVLTCYVIIGNDLGHKIESIGWCRNQGGHNTGPVLVGTNRGLIMECCIEAGEETKFFGGSVDQYFKQVYNFGKGEGKSKQNIRK